MATGDRLYLADKQTLDIVNEKIPYLDTNFSNRFIENFRTVAAGLDATVQETGSGFLYVALSTAALGSMSITVDDKLIYSDSNTLLNNTYMRGIVCRSAATLQIAPSGTTTVITAGNSTYSLISTDRGVFKTKLIPVPIRYNTGFSITYVNNYSSDGYMYYVYIRD